jgi:hypothetical protein
MTYFTILYRNAGDRTDNLEKVCYTKDTEYVKELIKKMNEEVGNNKYFGARVIETNKGDLKEYI